MTLSRGAERSLLFLGVVLLASFLMVRIYSTVGMLLGFMLFETPTSGAPSGPHPVKRQKGSAPVSIDFSLWSEKRIQAFRESLARHFETPLAILNIPRIHLKVPVFNGTNEAILNRGVGRIIGTAHVGGTGNLGIAGHRDGFFRGLKEMKKGDAVEVRASSAVFVYQVDDIEIVNPDDVRILKNRNVPTITLVTCYPFYFVGDAPKRYVLRCSLKQSKLLSGAGQAKAVTR